MDLLVAKRLYMTLYFVLLLYFVKLAICAQKTWKRNFEFDGKVSPTGNIILVRSRIHCGKSCMVDKDCASFFFLPEFLCQLHDNVFTSVVGLHDLDKTAYYVLHEVEPSTITPAPSLGPPITSTSTSAGTTIPTFACPPDNSIFRTVLLSNGNSFTYKIVTTQKTQSEARATCSADGAFLARVNTVAKMNMLLDLILNCPGYDVSTDYYVDGSNAYFQSDEDTPPWKFIDGTLVPMTNEFWGLTYPNNAFYEHCLRMRAAVYFMWDDCPCSRLYYFICEK